MRAFCRWEKKLSMRVLPQLVSQNTEASLGVSKPMGDLFARQSIDEEGSKRFVLAVSGI
jgi:hypothetical protein